MLMHVKICMIFSYCYNFTHYLYQARDAFAVLSTQIIDYMKSKNLTPNKPQPLANTKKDSLTKLIEVDEVEQDSLKMSRSMSSLSDMSLKFSDSSGMIVFNNLYTHGLHIWANQRAKSKAFSCILTTTVTV